MLLEECDRRLDIQKNDAWFKLGLNYIKFTLYYVFYYIKLFNAQLSLGSGCANV